MPKAIGGPMKKVLTLAVGIVLILLILTACGGTRTAAGIVVEVPHERYFAENSRPAVVSEIEWRALTLEQREIELTRISNEAIASLNACNIDKKTLLAWRKKMEELKRKYE